MALQIMFEIKMFVSFQRQENIQTVTIHRVNHNYRCTDLCASINIYKHLLLLETVLATENP